MVGALRFELRRPETTDLQSAPDTVTGLDTQWYTVGESNSSSRRERAVS